MSSSGMLRRVVLVRTDVSKEHRLHHQGDKNRRARLLVTLNVSRSQILFTLMMEEIPSSETSVLRSATRCKITEDDILHSHCRENLKSYTAVTGWTL
jgi:hypothetical protein